MKKERIEKLDKLIKFYKNYKTESLKTKAEVVAALEIRRMEAMNEWKR